MGNSKQKLGVIKMNKLDHNHQIPQTGYLRLPKILQLIPIGKSTWWAGVKSGRYPKGYILGKKITAWIACLF